MFGSVVRNSVRPSRRPARGRRPLSVEALDERITPTVDQMYDPTGRTTFVSAGLGSISTDQQRAQTFTVGRTGVLSEVDVYVFRFFNTDHGDLTLDLRALQPDGRPTSNAGGELLSVTIPATSVPVQTYGFVPFDLSAFDFHVTQGDRLAIVLHVAPDPLGDVTYQWDGSTNNPYANGAVWERDLSNHDWAADPGTDVDFGFRTWVDAPPQAAPVVTLPGGPAHFVAGDPPVVLSPAATVADPDSPDFDTGTLTVTTVSNMTVDDVLGIRSEGTAGGQIGVTGATVTFGGTAIGTFTGGNSGFPLTITLNANATVAATQALVRNLTFGNVSGNPFTGPRTVQVVLTDGDGGTSAAATTTVTVSPADQPPVVTTNFFLAVAEGGSGVIAQSNLEATDPDNGAAELTFTVTGGPAHGTLLVNGSAATTFTQADINAGIVSYTNDGSESFVDSFTFTVSDGHLATGSATFTVFVTQANDPPTVMANAGLTVVRGSSTVIGHAALDTADPDNTSSQLAYTVTAGPTHGTLQMGGAPVATFTQADLDAGRVRYVNDGGPAAADAFTFTVSDGTAATNPAGFAIAVDTAPQVTLSPVSQAAFAGSPLTLTAAAAGVPTPTVRWQAQAPGGSFADIPGATSTTYTFVPTIAAAGNRYRAVFANEVGSATTSPATLSIKPGLAVLAGPVAQAVPLGQTATFAASATGSTRPAVQWQVSTDGGQTYSNLPGATRATLSVARTSAAQDGALYRAVFRNASGQAATAPAALTVNYTATLAGKRAVAVRPGTVVTLAVQSKTTPTAVQWQVSTDRGHTWVDITGAAGDTYTFQATADDSGHLVRARVTTGARTVASPAATLTVTDPPALTASPADQSAAAGGSVVFAASADGIGVKVQWQVSTDGGRTFTNVRGATKVALVVKRLSVAMSGTVYRAVFTNAVGVTESAPATLTVLP
jgi:VCBS repeat-containing protein